MMPALSFLLDLLPSSHRKLVNPNMLSVFVDLTSRVTTTVDQQDSTGVHIACVSV